MAHRCVVALSLLLAVLLTACGNGEPAFISESDDSSVASTSTQPAESDGESTPQTSRSGVVFDGSAGAAHASAAVTGLLASINSGDTLGALAHIDPAERDLIADLYLTAVDASSEAWPQFGGHDAIAELEVEILSLSPLRVTAFNDHLAWVETDEVEFYMAAPTEVAAAFFSDNEPWGAGTEYSRESIAHRENDWSALTYLFGSSSDVLPGLMVSELDGRWYVSFGRTMLELLRLDAEYETTFPVERQLLDTTRSATPEEAVAGFLTALADDRMVAAAGHLVAAEGQAFADYPAMLDEWLPGLLGIEVDLDPSSLRVAHQDNGRAVVETIEISMTISGVDHDEGDFNDGDVLFEHHLQLADRCLTVDEDILCAPTDYAETAFAAIYRDLEWDGLRLVAVQNDDGWSVSLYETIAHYGLPLVSEPLYWFGYSEYGLAFSDGPFSYTLINETAKTLPVQRTDTITLEPQARNRILIARIETSEQGRVLAIDPATLDRECFITIWNTDMVTSDWGEEPEYYDAVDCDDHLRRPLEVPEGVELTLTLWGHGENLEPAVVKLQ